MDDIKVSDITNFQVVFGRDKHGAAFTAWSKLPDDHVELNIEELKEKFVGSETKLVKSWDVHLDGYYEIQSFYDWFAKIYEDKILYNGSRLMTCIFSFGISNQEIIDCVEGVFYEMSHGIPLATKVYYP